MDKININVELMNGLDLLFENKKFLQISLSPSDDKLTLKYLIKYLKNNYLKERPEMFISEEDVRPGIIVIINSTDSQLLGHLNYELQNNDQIIFISTLHGG